MMSMKRTICWLLIGVMLITLTACGKKETKETTEETTTGSQAEEARLPGKLYLIGLKEGEEPVLKSLRISGNLAGSTEFNEKKAATEGIRCIFELDEWVEIYPEVSGDKSKLCVWVFVHNEDQGQYEKMKFSEEMKGLAAYAEVSGDEEDAYASFYLNPEDYDPGYYDFVFTYNGKAVATLLTRFYGANELQEKSDSELSQIMKGLEAQ